MPRFLIPVAGLTLESSWRLGAVALHDPASGENLVDDWEAQETEHAGRPLSGSFEAVAAALRQGTLAEVTVEGSMTEREDRKDTLESAVDVVADALDLLRVFQHERAMAHTTMFGLPGEVRIAHLAYLAFDDPHPDATLVEDRLARNPAWLGFRNDGDVLGSTFDDVVKAEFNTSPLSRLAATVGTTDLRLGPARARLGIRLLSQAIREHRPEMRTLNTVMAVEALLGQWRTLELAQHVVALTCGRPFGQSCGRDFDACPYLAADLTRRRELDAVKALNAAPGHNVCSEWFDFLARYKDRSGVAHGDPTMQVSADDAGKDLYWAVKRLAFAAVGWLLDHPDDPAGALAADIRARSVSSAAKALMGRST